MWFLGSFVTAKLTLLVKNCATPMFKRKLATTLEKPWTFKGKLHLKTDLNGRWEYKSYNSAAFLITLLCTFTLHGENQNSNKEKCTRNKLEQARVACYQEMERDSSRVHFFCLYMFSFCKILTVHLVLKTCAGTVNMALLQLFGKDVFCKQDFQGSDSFSWFKWNPSASGPMIPW